MATTTLAYILKNWADQVSQVEGVRVVYAPELSFPEAVRAVRRLHIRKDKLGAPLLTGGEPIVLFSRRPLIRDEAACRHPVRLVGTLDQATKTIDRYKGLPATCDLQCLYLSKDWKKMEEFEVRYVSKAGISEVEALDVDFGEPIGTLSYRLTWNDLEDIQVTSEGLDTKGFLFSCKLSGWFFYGGDLRDPVIQEIDIFYKDYVTGVTIESDVITSQ